MSLCSAPPTTAMHIHDRPRPLTIASFPRQSRCTPGPSTSDLSLVMQPSWRWSNTAVAKTSGQRAACLELCSGWTHDCVTSAMSPCFLFFFF